DSVSALEAADQQKAEWKHDQHDERHNGGAHDDVFERQPGRRRPRRKSRAKRRTHHFGGHALVSFPRLAYNMPAGRQHLISPQATELPLLLKEASCPHPCSRTSAPTIRLS